MAFCAGCGAQMPDGSATCPKCGKATAAQSVGGGAAAAPAPTATGGMDPKLAAALSYLWITAIIFLLIEPYKNNKFVRFHSFQSLFLGIAFFVLNTILSITIIGLVLVPFTGLAHLILAIVGGVKAYGGVEWEIPVIGGIAKKQVG